MTPPATGRTRIAAALTHRTPDRLPVDAGGTTQTGMHASAVYALRQALALDPPGTPVKIIDVYQMLGEIAPDLQDALGADAVALAGTGTRFGFPAADWRPWRMPDGTPVLVPGGFNTAPEPDGAIHQYPRGDRSLAPSGRMPAGGHYFDVLVRQEPGDPDGFDPGWNAEEFGPASDAEIGHLVRQLEVAAPGGRAPVAAFGSLSFGDIATVPAPQLVRPRGIRDLELWYESLVERPAYVKRVFELQCERGLANLARLYAAAGDRLAVLRVTGADFGGQAGPLVSRATYRDVFLPFHRRVNEWVHRHTGWKTFMHTDGAIRPMIPDFLEAGFDILNPVQWTAAGMDPAALKREFGRDVTFWGAGVDTQRTLPFGTPDQVKDEARRMADLFAPGGGFVFATVHNVQAGTPARNLVALAEVLRELRD